MLARSIAYLYKLRKNLRLKTSELQRIQEKKLKAILNHAYQNVPFYRKKFKTIGIKVDDVKSLDDLTKIPITTKAEIQENIQEFCARNVDLSKCEKTTTSGSTGIPLTVFADRKAIDVQNAVYVRTLFQTGWRFSDKTLIVTDPRHFPRKKHLYQKFGLLREKHVSIFDDAEKQAAIIERYRPSVIKGYPSSLTLLAYAYKKKGLDLRPRLILTTAELLDSTTRRLICSTFQTELFDNYGTTELPSLAFECSEHSGYHINADNVLIEFVDKDGEPVAPGERGNIVATGLVNHAMPLIRYSLGDVGVPAKELCACGRTLPLMKALEGRADDFLSATDGRMISPTIFFPYPFESYIGIKQFRVTQDKIDKLTIQLAVDKDFIDNSLVWNNARNEIQRVFGEGMSVEFHMVDKISRDTSGKLRKVISRIHSSDGKLQRMRRNCLSF